MLMLPTASCCCLACISISADFLYLHTKHAYQACIPSIRTWLADSREDGLGVLDSPFQDGGTLQLGKEKLSSSNSEELHVNKNMSLAERNKQAQRRHRQRQRVPFYTFLQQPSNLPCIVLPSLTLCTETQEQTSEPLSLESVGTSAGFHTNQGRDIGSVSGLRNSSLNSGEDGHTGKSGEGLE